MITYLDKPQEKAVVQKLLHPLVNQWFFSKFKDFSLPQLYGVKEVHDRQNIMVVAPTGGTKCVTPDTPLLIEKDGEAQIIDAGVLADLARSKGTCIQKVGKEGFLYSLPNLHCYSLAADHKIVTSPALVYVEQTNDTLLDIKTEYGRRIKLSKDHPLLVETSEGLQWRSAQNIHVGERIAISKRVPLPEKLITFNHQSAIAKARAKWRQVISYEDYNMLKMKTKNFSLLTSLSTNDFYSLKALLQLTFDDISEATNISVTSIYNHFHNKAAIKKVQTLEDYFRQRLSTLYFEQNRLFIVDRSGKIHSFLYPLNADKKLVRWLAFLQAEGLIGDYRLGTHILVSQINRKELLQEFLETTKELFDLTFVARNYKDYALNSTAFCYFLCDLLGLKRGRGRYVPIPSWILNLSQTLKAHYLYVFFSLEGTIDSEGKNISLSQANKQKIETLNYLLLSFGILPSLRKVIKFATNTSLQIKRPYHEVHIYGIENIRTYLATIDIDHPRRHLLVEHLSKRNSGEYINKILFDYKKIRQLSRFYKNDITFMKNLGTIYEVVRRTGYITLSALSRLSNILLYLNQPVLQELYDDTSMLLGEDLAFVRVISKRSFHYKGIVVDLTVPNVHNFIGGHGGIYLHNTLTAFLGVLNELIRLADEKKLEDRIYAVYISPLKALNADIFVNLQQPLAEMMKLAEQQQKTFDIRVGLRTGDTTATEKQKMLKKSPHILVTTPESLAILLSSDRFRELLRDVQWCILDEVHALAENKRGVHLSLSLERLQELAPEMTRVGLSATVEPMDAVANFLVGMRDCKIAHVQYTKKTDFQVISPVPDLVDTTHAKLYHALYSLLDKLIQEHKTTLIFTNTRAGTERVVHHLKEKFPAKYTENIGAHHGSLSKKHRLDIEQRLRKGELKCVISSTSLELGLDIGYIDLVICLGSPKSVARYLQRAGRSGHKLHDTVKARLIPMDRDDLVECAVLLKNAVEKKIDTIHIPENCLDVLAQQIFGMAIADRWNIKDVLTVVKRSYCYRTLSEADFMDVIKYLAGEYATLQDRHIYAKIFYDHESGEIGRRGRMSRVIYMTNIGTIPDQTSILVKVNETVVGTLDEPFLERLQRGDVFVLGGQTYEFLFARGMVAQVKAAAGRQPTVPSWFSEQLPLSYDLAVSIQKFRRLLDDMFVNKYKKDEILEFIRHYLYVDENAAQALYRYFYEQHLFAGIPHDKRILVEFYQDDKTNKKYVLFHSLYGRRVNDVLSRAIAYAICKLQKKKPRDIELGINDNGFFLASDKPIQVLRALDALKKEDLWTVMKLALEKTEVLKRRFRHCAGRALMILRNYKGREKKVGKQQVSSMILMSALRRISDNFSILKEARREVLEDLMDIDHAALVLQRLREQDIELKQLHTPLPSPFAFTLITQSYTDILRMEDKVDFIRRMHKNVIAKLGKQYDVQDIMVKETVPENT